MKIVYQADMRSHYPTRVECHCINEKEGFAEITDKNGKIRKLSLNEFYTSYHLDMQDAMERMKEKRIGIPLYKSRTKCGEHLRNTSGEMYDEHFNIIKEDTTTDHCDSGDTTESGGSESWWEDKSLDNLIPKDTAKLLMYRHGIDGELLYTRGKDISNLMFVTMGKDGKEQRTTIHDTNYHRELRYKEALRIERLNEDRMKALDPEEREQYGL